MIDRVAEPAAVMADVIVPLQNEQTEITLRIELVDEPGMQDSGGTLLNHPERDLTVHLGMPALAALPAAPELDLAGPRGHSRPRGQT